MQIQRKLSESSLKSHPIMELRSAPMDVNSRKSSTISLASTVSRPVAKRISSQPGPEKCPYCERVFGFKGKSNVNSLRSRINLESFHLQPTTDTLSGVKKSH